ncbi:MAG: hypothetical protein KAH21_07495 [Spirochaetaceae bacterium]|nr:hypothetical protein [Spirochaetaceae bacterium]
MGLMLFGRDDSGEAEDFWKEREEDLGMPILAKTLGRVIRETTQAPLWGLFYTTENALYFQTFRSENWLSTMFSGGKKGRGRTKDETIEISAGYIESFHVKPKKGGFQKFFHQPPIVELRWKSPESGVMEELTFEMEGDAEALVSSISITG